MGMDMGVFERSRLDATFLESVVYVSTDTDDDLVKAI
jgi:hypothetical protein